MFKKIRSWHLFLLVGIVSILSLVLVQNYVLAQWEDPGSSPGDSDVVNIVTNPMTDDLDIQSKTIYGDSGSTGIFLDPSAGNATFENKVGYFTGDVKITGDLEVGSLTGGGAGGSSLWSEDGSDIYYGSGNVGIGSAATPGHIGVRHSLDVHKMYDGTNAEITLRSKYQHPSNGWTQNWSIYHNAGDAGFDDLRFWYGDSDTGVGSNVLALTKGGNVGIGTDTPNAKLTINGSIARADASLSGTTDTHVNLGYNGETADSYSTVGGGYHNKALDSYATVSGGMSNRAEGYKSTVVGGISSNAYGLGSVAGGYANQANGSYSTALGGYHNIAAGDGAWVGGTYGRAEHQGSFVWSDWTGDEDNKYYSNGVNTFNVRATGGLYFDGNVIIDGYLELDTMATAPPAGDCGAGNQGRMVLDYVNDMIYVCSSSTAGWHELHLTQP